jgi:hypothetical protein
MAVVLSGYLIICGGFEHVDNENSMPSTLSSTEIYNVGEDLWIEKAEMKSPIAFGGCVKIDE